MSDVYYWLWRRIRNTKHHITQTNSAKNESLSSVRAWEHKPVSFVATIEHLTTTTTTTTNCCLCVLLWKNPNKKKISFFYYSSAWARATRCCCCWCCHKYHLLAFLAHSWSRCLTNTHIQSGRQTEESATLSIHTHSWWLKENVNDAFSACVCNQNLLKQQHQVRDLKLACVVVETQFNAMQCNSWGAILEQQRLGKVRRSANKRECLFPCEWGFGFIFILSLSQTWARWQNTIQGQEK